MQNLPQPQAFTNDLTDGEKSVINELVQSTKQYPAQLQQLAIDASHLLSNSEQRLIEQQNTGFFKRVVHKFTGKQSESIRQNQADIINMQKYAWHYLQELQRQNLIAGKSIAVIRNNLVTVNDAIIETRTFLEEVIDKIIARLEKVESKTELLTWAMDKEAEKRKYKVIPQTIKTLLITYDFIKSNYKYIQNYRDMNAVFATLDKLGIDLEEEISLNDFIHQLIDEIEIFGGLDKYSDIIDLQMSDCYISSQYLQENIAGSGINALYYLWDNYRKITDLLEEVDHERRTTFISKFFGYEFGHLLETYTIEELVFEIIGGCLTVIDLHKEENNLIGYGNSTLAIDDTVNQNPEASSLLEIKNQESEQEVSKNALDDKKEVLFHIDWRDIDDYPFDIDRVKDIVSDGKFWVVHSRDESYSDKLHKSSDGITWSQLEVALNKIDSIKHIDGVWFVFDDSYRYGYGSIIFSETLSEWNFIKKPVFLQTSSWIHSTQNFVKYGNQWLWVITENTHYTYYTENIFFRDSKETGFYDKSYIYIADSLDGDWTGWKKTLNLSEGAVIEKIATIPNTDLLMAFCKYDWLYYSRKNLQGSKCFMYCFDNNKWQQIEIEWHGYGNFREDLYLKKYNGTYYLYDFYIYTSNNGNTWKERDDLPRYTGRCFEINETLFLFKDTTDREYYISHNLEEYKKIKLEKGSWRHFEVNNHQILAVYRAEHIQKPFLRLGMITVS